MGDLFILQIANGLSLLLGLIFFIISTIFLDDVVAKSKGAHNSTLSPSPTNISSSGAYYESITGIALKFFATFAIWLSLFQIGLTTLAFPRLGFMPVWKLWWKFHSLVAVGMVAVFSVALAESASSISGSKGNALIGFSAIECIFCIATSCFVCTVTRRSGFGDY